MNLEEMIRGVVKENAKQIADRMLSMSELSVQQIAEITELDASTVQKLADQRKTVNDMARPKK